MGFTNVFDITQPPDTQLANQLGLDLRNLALNIQQRMAVISGLSTGMPDFAADAQPANWNGVLFFATDNGHIYQFNNPNWTDITTDFLTYASATTPANEVLASPNGAAGAMTPRKLVEADLPILYFFEAAATTDVVIPANTLQVGSRIDIYMGSLTGAGSGVPNQLTVGPTTVNGAASQGIAAAGCITADLCCVVAGATGVLQGTYQGYQLGNSIGPAFFETTPFDMTNPFNIVGVQGVGNTIGLLRVIVTP